MWLLPPSQDKHRSSPTLRSPFKTEQGAWKVERHGLWCGQDRQIRRLWSHLSSDSGVHIGGWRKTHTPTQQEPSGRSLDWSAYWYTRFNRVTRGWSPPLITGTLTVSRGHMTTLPTVFFMTWPFVTETEGTTCALLPPLRTLSFTVMPHRTVRAPHVRLCGQVTTLPHVRWKKIEFFFRPFSSLFDPFPRDSFPRTKTIFFLPKKNQCVKNRVEMESNNLLKSTFTDDCRTQKGDQKTCLLCGLRYCWRPSHCRTHLGLEGSTKQVQLCKPYPEHCDLFSEVVQESSWRISAKRLVCLMIDHSRLSGPETRWTCNGTDSLKKERLSVSLWCSRVWRQGLCHRFLWRKGPCNRRRYSRLLPRMDSSSSCLASIPRWSGSRYKLLCVWLCYFPISNTVNFPVYLLIFNCLWVRNIYYIIYYIIYV